MRVLGFDPGAERMGWASLEYENSEITYHMSGVISIPKGNLKPQQYKLELVVTLAHWVPTLLDLTEPDEVASEIVPSVGGGGFMASTQGYQANTAITVVHTIACLSGLPVIQYGANTVQKRIAIGTKPGGKVSKVQVRNGVIQLFPELEPRKREWVKIFEEPDAIAVAATHVGARNDK